jgi:hypothetical protein
MGANLTSTVASAVWTFNASAGTLVPAWTNSNGKAATATLLYDLDANVLLLAGDMGVFNTVLRSNAVKVVSPLFFPCFIRISDRSWLDTCSVVVSLLSFTSFGSLVLDKVSLDTFSHNAMCI